MHIIYHTTPNVCCRTTCGKLKFKFARSCAPVDLSWCPSASQGLTLRTSFCRSGGED